jgi:hypothetical protein
MASSDRPPTQSRRPFEVAVIDKSAGSAATGINARPASAFAQKQAPAADRPTRMLCQGLRARASTHTSLPVGTKGSSRGGGLPRPARDASFSSRPTVSSSIAGVAGHAGGAEAAERRPRDRPSTAGFANSGRVLVADPVAAFVRQQQPAAAPNASNRGCLHENAVAPDRSAVSLPHLAEQAPAEVVGALSQLVQGGSGPSFAGSARTAR